MLGVHTRLRLTPDQDALLGALLARFSTLARTAYQRVETGQLEADRQAVYAWATAQGLTSHQALALSAQVEQWRATDRATLEHRIETLRLRIDALEQAVWTLDRRLAPGSKSKPLAAFLSPKLRARLLATRFQKHRSLCNKRQQLARLETRLAQGQYSRVFGGRRLLSQRHRLGEADSPWTLDTWRQEWTRKRQGSITLVGKATHTAGNQSAQVILDTTTDGAGQVTPTGKATLVLRLTERQALERMQAVARQQGVPMERLTGKMAYKRLSVPVSFPLAQAAQLYRAQAQGLPITVSISRKLTPKGKRQQPLFSRPGQRKKPKKPVVSSGTKKTAPTTTTLPEIGIYLHVAFDPPPPPVQVSRHRGCLGVDVNSWGLSWAAVDAQGQLLKGTHPVTGKPFALKGDIVLPLRDKTTDQVNHLIRQAVVELGRLAQQYQLAIAIEALDFACKKARLRERPPAYARMLSRLNTAGFANALASRCQKIGIALHKVSPAWTSVAGFAKYGMSLSLSVDQAGAFAIGRAGVRAKGHADKPLPTHAASGKKLSPKFVRELQARRDSRVLHYKESVRFAKPLPGAHQRMCPGQSGLTWRHVRKALGHRSAWPQLWSRKTMPAAPEPAQDATASRLGGDNAPGVCGRTVRPLATSRPKRVFVSVEHQRSPHQQMK